MKLKFSILALLMAAACSTPHKTHQVTSDEEAFKASPSPVAITNSAANAVGANYFAEVEFRPGSQHLSENSRSQINALFNRAAKDGKLKDVKVLSWADEPYPSESMKELPKNQRHIAEARNENIEKYVKSIESVSVETYNMAEHPNVVASWFDTTDEKLKSSLVAAGLPTTADDTRYASKTSHAVVLVSVE